MIKSPASPDPPESVRLTEVESCGERFWVDDPFYDSSYKPTGRTQEYVKKVDGSQQEA